MEAHSLDGILFTSLENIRYFCGFTGSDGALTLGPTGSFFLTDSRYWTQADGEVRGSKIVHYKKKIEGIASLLLDLDARMSDLNPPLSLSHSIERSSKNWANR